MLCNRLLIYQKITSIKALYSSFTRVGHNSLSRGPAFVVRSGIELRDLRVAASTILDLGVLISQD